MEVVSETNINSHISVEVIDLGKIYGNDFKGIFCAKKDIHAELAGVTEQFLSEAHAYHKKYTNYIHFQYLITKALKKTKFVMEKPVILDIGSGSGNTVIPLLKLFPESTVIACDISPNMLAILRDYLENMSDASSERCCLMATDAMNDYFKRDHYDLVVGAAILHHVFDVRKTMFSIYNSLKPGGKAIFFEPFEAGHALLRIAFQNILERAEEIERKAWKIYFSKRKPILSDEIKFFLQSKISEYDKRISPNLDHKLKMDDKWYFTRAYFERLEEEYGFSKLVIYTNQETEQPLVGQTRTFLRIGMGKEPDALPDFAWEILKKFENSMSRDLKHDLMPTGTIILTK